ncbi:MAG TPA: hypothetical protein PLC65_02940, partial [Bacteroidia bacterium]|nr:hypothetical protein [Bacteroidia bacterium]
FYWYREVLLAMASAPRHQTKKPSQIKRFHFLVGLVCFLNYLKPIILPHYRAFIDAQTGSLFLSH